MARPTSRRSLRFENLEDRQLLSSAAPNNDQQLTLQLINMARSNPQAAAQWLTKGTDSSLKKTLQHYNVDAGAVLNTISSSRPLPPVAWNSNLADAAQAHSQDMADNQYQSHTGSDGTSADDRIRNSGYKAKSTGENAFAYANSVDNAMQAFLYDWGVADAGHRRNLLQPGVSAGDSFTDVGVGVVKTSGKIGPVVVTQDFASRPDAAPQIVGVVYGDNDGDGFYSSGEGKGGVEIDAVNLDTGKTASTKTWDSGGYQMPLSAGRYQVTASDNDVVIKQVNVNVSDVNVSQDFVTTGSWDGRRLSDAIAKPATTQAVKPASAPVTQAAVVVSTPVVAVSAPVFAVSVPVKASAPTPTMTPVTTAATVSVPTTASSSPDSSVAFFAPADWKGPTITTQAPTSDAAPAKSPFAAWITWKANSN